MSTSSVLPAMRPDPSIKAHIVTREFKAPRDLVWQVNSDADHLAKWLAPAGMSGFYKTMEFREGGSFHYGQRSDDGKLTMWGRITYLEISPKDRMVFLQSFSDEHGGMGSHPMAPTWPKVMYCVNTFEDLGNGHTRMTINWTPAEGAGPDELATFEAARAGMDQGWKGTLDKLERHLATLQA